MRGAQAHRMAVAVAVLLPAVLLTAACAANLSPRGGWADPVEHDGHVYVAGGIDGATPVGNVIRVELDNGQVDGSWIYPPTTANGLGTVYSTPAAQGESIYVAGYTCTVDQCNSQVVAISTEDARAQWVNRSISGTVVGPLALAGADDDATLLVGTGTSRIEGGSVTALDPADGSQRWRLPTEGDVWGGVTVDGDVGYFGTFDGILYAINLDPGFGGTAEGRILWQLDAGAPIVSRPAVADGALYFGILSDGANLFRLDLDTRRGIREGDLEGLSEPAEWAIDAGAWIWASPLPLDERLLVSNVDGDLFAVDAENGTELWEERASLRDSIVSPPAVSEEGALRTLFASSRDGVFIVDADSGVVDDARFNTDSGVAATPLLAEGLLYVHTLDGELMAFSPTSLGRELCREIQDIRESCN